MLAAEARSPAPPKSEPPAPAAGSAARVPDPRPRSPTGAGAEPWQLRLYRRSIKKKETLRAFLRLLPRPTAGRCLEVGCGTGVQGWFLRRRGGTWTSIGVDPEEVGDAGRLLETGVLRGDPVRLPFADASFEVALAVNLIRDVEEDLAFARELARVLRPGGALLVNCPDATPGRPGNRLKRALGFGADRLRVFGDARDGYRRGDFVALLRRAGLEVERVEAYSGFLTELVENALKYAYYRSERRAAGVLERHPAGTWNVTGSHFGRIGWRFRLFEAAYPALRGLTLLDRLLPTGEGYMFCARARKPGAAR